MSKRMTETQIVSILKEAEAIRRGFKRVWAINRQDRCGLIIIVRLRN
ncbi:hypothetical protein [Psychrobacter sp. PSP]|nr:hypothetical protein [Psychrobacter sp. PSP]